MIQGIVLGNITINLNQITANKIPGTKKQKVGKALIQHSPVEYTTQDWHLMISAELTGANKDADRTAIEEYDDLTPISFTDNQHNGTYIIIPGTLQFNDLSANVNAIYQFSVELIQYQQ